MASLLRFITLIVAVRFIALVVVMLFIALVIAVRFVALVIVVRFIAFIDAARFIAFCIVVSFMFIGLLSCIFIDIFSMDLRFMLLFVVILCWFFVFLQVLPLL